MLFSCSVIYRATPPATLFGQFHGEVRRIALIRSLRAWRSRQLEVWFLTNRSGEPHLIGVFENPLQLDIT